MIHIGDGWEMTSDKYGRAIYRSVPQSLAYFGPLNENDLVDHGALHIRSVRHMANFRLSLPVLTTSGTLKQPAPQHHGIFAQQR